MASLQVHFSDELRNLYPGTEGAASVTATVFNATDSPMTGFVDVLPEFGASAEWFRIAQPRHREFRASEAQQFDVSVSIPRGTPASTFGFRLVAVNEANPDADYSESDRVALHWNPPLVKRVNVAVVALLSVIAVIGMLAISGVVYLVANREIGAEETLRTANAAAAAGEWEEYWHCWTQEGKDELLVRVAGMLEETLNDVDANDVEKLDHLRSWIRTYGVAPKDLHGVSGHAMSADASVVQRASKLKRNFHDVGKSEAEFFAAAASWLEDARAADAIESHSTEEFRRSFQYTLDEAMAMDDDLEQHVAIWNGRQDSAGLSVDSAAVRIMFHKTGRRWLLQDIYPEELTRRTTWELLHGHNEPENHGIVRLETTSRPTTRPGEPSFEDDVTLYFQAKTEPGSNDRAHGLHNETNNLRLVDISAHLNQANPGEPVLQWSNQKRSVRMVSPFLHLLPVKGSDAETTDPSPPAGESVFIESGAELTAGSFLYREWKEVGSILKREPFEHRVIFWRDHAIIDSQDIDNESGAGSDPTESGDGNDAKDSTDATDSKDLVDAKGVEDADDGNAMHYVVAVYRVSESIPEPLPDSKQSESEAGEPTPASLDTALTELERAKRVLVWSIAQPGNRAERVSDLNEALLDAQVAALKWRTFEARRLLDVEAAENPAAEKAARQLLRDWENEETPPVENKPKDGEKNDSTDTAAAPTEVSIDGDETSGGDGSRQDAEQAGAGENVSPSVLNEETLARLRSAWDKLQHAKRDLEIMISHRERQHSNAEKSDAAAAVGGTDVTPSPSGETAVIAELQQGRLAANRILGLPNDGSLADALDAAAELPLFDHRQSDRATEQSTCLIFVLQNGDPLSLTQNTSPAGGQRTGKPLTGIERDLTREIRVAIESSLPQSAELADVNTVAAPAGAATSAGAASETGAATSPGAATSTGAESPTGAASPGDDTPRAAGDRAVASRSSARGSLSSPQAVAAELRNTARRRRTGNVEAAIRRSLDRRGFDYFIKYMYEPNGRWFTWGWEFRNGRQRLRITLNRFGWEFRPGESTDMWGARSVAFREDTEAVRVAVGDDKGNILLNSKVRFDLPQNTWEWSGTKQELASMQAGLDARLEQLGFSGTANVSLTRRPVSYSGTSTVMPYNKLEFALSDQRSAAERAFGSVAISPDGQWLAGGDSRGRLRIWRRRGTGAWNLTQESRLGEFLKTFFPQIRLQMRSVAFSADNSRIAVAVTVMFQPQKENEAEKLPSSGYVMVLHRFSPALPYFLMPRLEVKGTAPLSVAFSRDSHSSYLAAGLATGQTRRWRWNSSSFQYEPHRDIDVNPHGNSPVLSLAFGPPGKSDWLAVGQADGTLRLGRWTAGGEWTEYFSRRSAKGDQGAVRGIAFSPRGALLAGVSDSGLRMWHLDDLNVETQ